MMEIQLYSLIFPFWFKKKIRECNNPIPGLKDKETCVEYCERESIEHINCQFFGISSSENEDPNIYPKTQRPDIALDQRQKLSPHGSKALEWRLLKPLSNRSGYVKPQKNPTKTKQQQQQTTETWFRDKLIIKIVTETKKIYHFGIWVCIELLKIPVT